MADKPIPFNEDDHSVSPYREDWPEEATLDLTISPEWWKSSVKVGGKNLPCASINIDVVAGGHTEVTLVVLGAHVERQVRVTGVLKIDSVGEVEFEEQDGPEDEAVGDKP